MNDLMKKGFLLGLGAAITGKERIEKYVDQLVYKGELTPKEADEWLQSLIDKGKTTEEEWSEQTKDRMQQLLKKYGVATQEDVERIEKRLGNIELALTKENENNQ